MATSPPTLARKEKNPRHFLAGLANPGQAPYAYILLTFLIAVPVGAMGNALHEVLKSALTTQGWPYPHAIEVLICAALVIALALILQRVLGFGAWLRSIIRGLRTSQRPTLQIQFPPGNPPHTRGLVALVSQGEINSIPAAPAIKYHSDGNRLEHLWLIHTPQPAEEPSAPSQSSYKNAVDLEVQYKKQGNQMKGVRVTRLEVARENDISESFHAAERALFEAKQYRLGSGPADLLIDLTGGTKNMTAGVALAAVQESCALQYMRARRSLQDGTADRSAGSDPVLVETNFIHGAD